MLRDEKNEAYKVSNLHKVAPFLSARFELVSFTVLAIVSCQVFKMEKKMKLEVCTLEFLSWMCLNRWPNPLLSWLHDFHLSDMEMELSVFFKDVW